MKVPRSVQLKMFRQELLDHQNDLEDEVLFHALLVKGEELHSISNYQFHYWEEGCKAHAGLARIMVLHLLEDETDRAIVKAEWWEKFFAGSKRASLFLGRMTIGMIICVLSIAYGRWAMSTSHPFIAFSPVFFLYTLAIWFYRPNEN